MAPPHPDAQLIAIAGAAIAAGRKVCEVLREEYESRVEPGLDDADDFVSLRVKELLERKGFWARLENFLSIPISASLSRR